MPKSVEKAFIDIIQQYNKDIDALAYVINMRKIGRY